MCRIGIVAFALFFVFPFCMRNCVLAQELSKAEPESKFQAAQRNIFTAVNLLEAYIRENPNGKNAAVARTQLTMLKDLGPSSPVIAPVFMAEAYGYTRTIEWNVVSVATKQAQTVVTLKIRNLDANEPRRIYAFDRHPLVMLDNKGEFYPMLKAPAVPPGVRVVKESDKNMWIFQPQRVLTLHVVFARLAPDATGGQILYKDNEQGTKPAQFSLVNEDQPPKEE